VDKWVVNSDTTKEDFIRVIEKLYDDHKYCEFSVKTGRQRTSQQNKALHKYLGLLAEQLNNAGLDMRKVLRPSIDIPWTTKLAKEFLWRPIQKAVIDKESTTQADRNEYTKVYEVLNRHTAQSFGISLPWPTKEQEQ
jgi:hypothetical protein